MSRDGGNWPVWHADREIVFSAGLPWLAGTAAMAVTVGSSSTAFESGIPRRLFPSSGGGAWDVTADGQRFLTLMPQAPVAAPAPAFV